MGNGPVKWDWSFNALLEALAEEPMTQTTKLIQDRASTRRARKVKKNTKRKARVLARAAVAHKVMEEFLK